MNRKIISSIHNDHDSREACYFWFAGKQNSYISGLVSVLPASVRVWCHARQCYVDSVRACVCRVPCDCVSFSLVSLVCFCSVWKKEKQSLCVCVCVCVCVWQWKIPGKLNSNVKAAEVDRHWHWKPQLLPAVLVNNTKLSRPIYWLKSTSVFQCSVCMFELFIDMFVLNKIIMFKPNNNNNN